MNKRKPKMASLLDLLSKATQLKPTATVVRGRDGKVKVEREELLSAADKQEKLASSVEAGMVRGEVENQNEDLLPPRHNFFPQREGEIFEFYCDQGENWSQGEWMASARHPVQKKDSSPALLFGTVGSIRVATFNVWFSAHQWKERLTGLVGLLVHVETADVICLQEVTPQFWTKLLENEEIRKLYRVTDNKQCATLGTYGVAMLIRRSSIPVPTTITWVTLPTRMGRSVLVVVFEQSSAEQTSTAQNNNQEFSSFSSVAIATVHLESLKSEETRTKQLQIINNALTKYGTAMLLGDYNITASGPRANPEEHDNVVSLLPGYIDLWVKEHGVDGDVASASAHASGTTFDASSNLMLKALRPSGEPEDHARIDRIMIKEQRDAVHAHGIRIIGNQPIGPDLFISDHFGLICELSLPV